MRCLYNGEMAAGGKLDWSLNWTAWLGEDTIASSSWFITEGDGTLLLLSEGLSDGITVAVVEGGTSGVQYRLTNQITTAEGLIDSRTILITAR